jgi:hypothetical protein
MTTKTGGNDKEEEEEQGIEGRERMKRGRTKQ